MKGDRIRILARPFDATMPVGALSQFVRGWHLLTPRSYVACSLPRYRDQEQIEANMLPAGTAAESQFGDSCDFDDFVRVIGCPQDHVDDAPTAIREERLLEYFVARWPIDLVSSAHFFCVEVAVCASPSAPLLRGRRAEALAIDLKIIRQSASVLYFETQDATAMQLETNSVGSASLQCAFAMFGGDQDSALIRKFARVLRLCGRGVIPHAHTDACRYQRSRFVGVPTADTAAAKRVVRDCWRVSSSSKYSVQTLQERTCRPTMEVGLVPRFGGGEK